jgi:hypothetical protein
MVRSTGPREAGEGMTVPDRSAPARAAANRCREGRCGPAGGRSTTPRGGPPRPRCPPRACARCQLGSIVPEHGSSRLRATALDINGVGVTDVFVVITAKQAPAAR